MARAAVPRLTWRAAPTQALAPGCTRGHGRLRPAHGRLPARVRGRLAVVEDLGVRPPDGRRPRGDTADEYG